MSSLNPLTGRLPLRICLLVLMLLGITAGAQAQCPVRDPHFTSKVDLGKLLEEEPLLPEQGYLSFTKYTNLFFAFSFELPSGVQWQPLILPLTPEKQHALLAMRFERGKHSGYITATAVDPAPGMEVATPEELEARIKAWARTGGDTGVSSRFAIPDYMLQTGHFYYVIRHKGSNYAAQYSTYINNYAIKIVIATNDQDVLHKAKLAMSEAKFYCLQDDRTLQTTEGKPVKLEGRPYEGPTIPTFRVNAALQDQPGRKIPLGGVTGGVYRNPDLGVQYDVPKGWQVLSSVMPDDPPHGDIAIRENAFLHACSQTFLRTTPAGSAGPSDAWSKPMIIFRALDPNCLSMHTATRLSDKQVTDEVAANLEALGEFGKIASDELTSSSDRIFMVFHGTVGFFNSEDNLAKRMSQTILATRYNKLLLVWTVIAPTGAALK